MMTKVNLSITLLEGKKILRVNIEKLEHLCYKPKSSGNFFHGYIFNL